MALVSATVAIAAITAVAGAEKSEWQSVIIAPLQAFPELSSHLMITPLWLQLQSLSRTGIQPVQHVQWKTTASGLHQPQCEMVT